MDLSGLSAFTGIYPGYVQGQNNQATLAQNQEAAKQAQMRSQELLDDRAALTALGNAFGVAPPNAPTPQGPGQPSTPAAPPPAPPDAGPPPVPATAAPPPPPQAGPPPGQPPNPATQALAPAQGGAAPQAPAARPAPPSAPPPAAAPARAPLASPVAGTSGGPGGPVIPGQMTADQLAARIIAANPSIKQRPDLLIRAMQKGQALLAPEAKADLVALQLQQKVDAVTARLEQTQMNNDTKVAVTSMVNDMKAQIQQLKDAGAADRLTTTLTGRLEALEKTLAAKDALADKDNTAKGDRNDATIKGRKDVADTNADAGITKAQIAAGARSEAQGVTQQFRAYAMQAADINKKISGLLAGGRQLSDLKPDEKSQYDALTAQRTALAAKAQALADKAGKIGVKMPKFADEVKDAGKKPVAAAESPADDAAPADDGIPDGAPTATGPDGKKIYFDGKSWVPAPAAAQ